MKNDRTWVVSGLVGALVVAACHGKLVVDSSHGDGGVNHGGTSGSGGPLCCPDADVSGSGGTTGPVAAGGKMNHGGTSGAGGSTGDSGPAGGALNQGGAGGAVGASGAGGTTGDLRILPDGGTCYPGTAAELLGMAGYLGAGGLPPTGTTPTCPLDQNGFATVSLTDLCGGTATGFQSATGYQYPCMVGPDALLKGLQCDEVSTDHDGFTRTVGCGFETVELHSYISRSTFDLEDEYAATYDQSTGKLSGLVVKHPNQFGTCSSYAYKAGDSPPDCPSATTYRCHRIPTGNADDAAYVGCRSIYEAGCSSICDFSPPNSCTIATLQGVNEVDNACPCECKHRARCSLDEELSLRLAGASIVPHPECNCALPPTGEPCGSWCNSQTYKNPDCPGL